MANPQNFAGFTHVPSIPKRYVDSPALRIAIPAENRTRISRFAYAFRLGLCSRGEFVIVPGDLDPSSRHISLSQTNHRQGNLRVRLTAHRRSTIARVSDRRCSAAPNEVTDALLSSAARAARSRHPARLIGLWQRAVYRVAGSPTSVSTTGGSGAREASVRRATNAGGSGGEHRPPSECDCH